MQNKPDHSASIITVLVALLLGTSVGVANETDNAAPAGINKAAAQQLRDRGIEKLVFIKRFTFTANHVYTEYVNSKWTPGGGLAVLDLSTGKATDLVPDLTNGVVSRFDLSFDGMTVVFDYKQSEFEGYRIYEVGLDGTGLRQITFPRKDEAELVKKYRSRNYHHGTDDLHPCYLPDGDIVFVSTRSQYSILCDSRDNFTTKNLFRVNPATRAIKQLSNSPVSEASPAILPDGRILYHRWEYVDKAAGNNKALWAMRPDGSNSSEVYGNTISFPETMIYPRPIPGTRNKIVMLGASHWVNNALGTVIVVDTTQDNRSAETMTFVTKDIHALKHSGFDFRGEDGKWHHDPTGKTGRLFKDPYPLSEQLFIVSHKPKGPAWSHPTSYDLALLNDEGEETVLYKDNTISCWHPYPIMKREKPPILTSPLDPKLAEQGLALCVMSDVYEGLNGVDRGVIKYLRVLEQTPRPWAARKTWRNDAAGLAHSALGDGHLGLKAQYGVVPVAEDGSATFYVPAGRNIYFQALDKDCRMVQTERTFVHYMPGETRSCIGCHETQNKAPGDSRAHSSIPAYLPPSHIGPQPGETQAKKLFDYDRQIQPIWDKHCLACHGSDKGSSAGLNLRGTEQGVYSVSYNNLIKLGKSEKQLLGNRRLRNEDTGSAAIHYIPPYSMGALSSPLAVMLSGGSFKLKSPTQQTYAKKLTAAHPHIKLDKKDLLKITNWLDVNCPFHPSYWGRLNAEFKNHANFRPDIQFEDALRRTVPQTISEAETTP